MRLLERLFFAADASAFNLVMAIAIVVAILVVALYCVNLVVERFASTNPRSASRFLTVKDDQRFPSGRELTGLLTVPEWSPAERSSRSAR